MKKTLKLINLRWINGTAEILREITQTAMRMTIYMSYPARDKRIGQVSKNLRAGKTNGHNHENAKS